MDSQEIEKLAQKPINDQYEKQVKFIAIGRFVEAKGFDRLVSSAYKLHKEGYEFEVWILGQGEGKNDIGQMCIRDRYIYGITNDAWGRTEVCAGSI